VGVCFLITIIVLGVFLAQGSNPPTPYNEQFPPTILLISLDGFRWDYLDTYKDNCTNLLKFASEGVRATSMKPVFPSKTFPVHPTNTSH
jgi:predicted AlkP superfamily pyrophosphatase or phosphodiesterase